MAACQASAGPPALVVSGEAAQHTSLLRACAAPRWLWVFQALRRAPHRREAALLLCTALVRRTGNGHQRQTSGRVSSDLRRTCVRCLWGGCSAYELAARARRATLVVGVPSPTKGAAPPRGRSPSVHNCDATYWQRSPTPDRRPRVKRSQAGLRSLPLRRRLSIRACCARAPRRAGCGCSKPHEGRRTGERPLSFGARPWCDVPATATNARPAAVCQANAGGLALAVSGEDSQHTSLLRVCAAPCWLWVFQAPRRAPHRRDAALLRYTAVVRRNSNNHQRQTGGRVSSDRKRACARCLWGGGSAYELAARARRAALVVIRLRLQAYKRAPH